MPNEEFVSTDTVRDKLIIAGIAELEKHGISDFSLRRVAASSNVSCAAPYKHFKNKEDFIVAIVDYIYNQWLILSGQIVSIFEKNPEKLLTEMCVAYTRFCMGNSHFRSVIMMDINSLTSDNTDIKQHISGEIENLIKACYADKDVSDDALKLMTFRINAMVQATALISDNTMTNEEAVGMLRECILAELK